MLALGIDTSNYATSLAVVDYTRREVVCALKQFLPVPKGGLGLRQSDALFHHTVALPEMLVTLKKQCDFSLVKAVGVSQKPRPQEGSYMPCFLAGVNFASAFAAGAGAKMLLTSHQQGHLAAAIFGAQQPLLEKGDLLFFHVSGGTTELAHTEGSYIKEILGKSLDLYAGQAVDRLGVRLGLSFPAGVEVSSLAESCEEQLTPQPKPSVRGMDCHLSGLQNQCDQLLNVGKSAAYVSKYCLSFIGATVESMLRAARKKHNNLPVLCAGGVMCSSVIRRQLAPMENVFFAPAELSSDNAVGVALLAAKEAKYG